MNDVKAVEGHYAGGGIVARILDTLGPDTAVTPDTLAPMDQFHGGGLAATKDLLALLRPEPGEHLLDLGCGIGGPARWIASQCRCRVTGIDLTADFCRAAEALTARTGQTQQVRIVHGSALQTPFADAAFDRAYSQNVVMNIADKRGFYREAFRVLKPGGLLALSNLGAGPNGQPYYPTPWAGTAATSFLASLDETRADLAAAGFEIVALEDTTARMRPQRIKALEAFEAGGFPEQGPHVVIGERFKTFQLNSLRSLRDGRVTSIEALLRKPG